MDRVFINSSLASNGRAQGVTPVEVYLAEAAESWKCRARILEDLAKMVSGEYALADDETVLMK
jgi:hypothetical protein